MTAVNCPMCDLRFATRNERDWHLRNEHEHLHDTLRRTDLLTGRTTLLLRMWTSVADTPRQKVTGRDGWRLTTAVPTRPGPSGHRGRARRSQRRDAGRRRPGRAPIRQRPSSCTLEGGRRRPPFPRLSGGDVIVSRVRRALVSARTAGGRATLQPLRHGQCREGAPELETLLEQLGGLVQFVTLFVDTAERAESERAEVRCSNAVAQGEGLLEVVGSWPDISGPEAHIA